MRCIFFIAVTSFLSLISTANAEQCNSYIAQKLTLNDPVSLVDKLKNASFEKGEFETTAQYDARIEKAKAEITGDKIIPIDINNKYVVYNADDQQFAVGAWAFPGEITLFRSMSWEDRKGINFGILDRVAVRVSTNEKIMDSYEASNAFGVTATVQKIRTDIISVFERASSYIKDEDLFGVDNRDIKNVLPDDTLQNGVGGRPVMHFSAATSDARNLKTSVKGAILITLKEPYHLYGENRITPTIQGKRDIYEYANVIVADIKCAFIFDANKTVLSAVNTN